MGVNGHNENWFVQFQGHSLGPITTDQLLTSLKQQELGPDDKVASSRDRAWRPLSTYPEFSSYFAAIQVKRPVLHKPPPPVETLLKKKKKTKKPAAKKSAEAPTIPAPSPAPVTTASTPPSESVHVPAILPEPESKPEPKAATNPSPVPTRPQLDFPKAPMPQIDQLALLEVFRDWKKKSEPKPEPLPAPALPAKPAISNPQAFVESSQPRQEINLKIDLRFNQKTMLALAIVGLIVAVTAIYYPWKKTGDSESLRSPSPPSPTMQPSSQGDPIPVLKAPTRPQRE